MSETQSRLQRAEVVANQRLCRDHFRLTLRFDRFAPAAPGQFAHICPDATPPSDDRDSGGQAVELHHRTPSPDGSPVGASRGLKPAARGEETVEHNSPEGARLAGSQRPLLRRAFSIAGLRQVNGHTELEIIHRVVGVATRWMASLCVGDCVSVLAPLGNGFPINSDKSSAWLVAGGVGLPPMLWLAQALYKANRRTVAFCGAQTADLLPLSLDSKVAVDADATTATLSALEFATSGVPVVISTDDGSLGFRGYVGAAMAAYHEANPTQADELVVYTCGPEPMMRFVAGFCKARGIECYICMERAMACGMGTCQSCVVEVVDESDPEGWRYQLCCTEGPVFDSRQILWEPVKTA
ncbi:MAG: dihydroorotate dehydrogenase electron transfer subunit [Planctomycetes bacterium]|nr:dihydroorotate dehydrogenase electron transfer subunit [Planctomycetota bacterium]